MKLWEKGTPINNVIEKFTVGRDREMDLYLASSDVLGTIAHIIMLESVGLLSSEELPILRKELSNIYKLIQIGNFKIEEGIEDVHSQVEYLLTERLGEVGKKVHSGRSRNDQVLVDLRLFTRDNIIDVVDSVNVLFSSLINLSNQYKNILLPGYTHLQIAMPSSFGLWFGAYAEALTDDLELLLSAYRINNQNPLGSAAGYGSSFPLNRTLTTQLLGFDNLNYNVVYAQMGRGKVEKITSFALANLASTIGRMATDLCLYMSQNFGFISLPDELTTGSSIMPHKKNPDVFELIRARCNKIQALPVEINAILGNLPSGYFRDMQMIKESYLPVFGEIQNIIEIANFMISKVKVNDCILEDPKYKYLFSVEVVNNAVLQGVPFRDAYKLVGKQIAEGNFNPSFEINHTHEGSIGNLCNNQIKEKFNEIFISFNMDKIAQIKDELLK
ncbi:MAG: argininosuccinate lyase [Bacteroidetes bacterium]|nr:argininosuccinate lyase [Bacteroidota bacterium]